MKQVPMSDEELDVLIMILKQVIPSRADESTVFNLVNRLQVVRRMT